MSTEPMTVADAQHRAILSLLDVVQELAEGLAAGQRPTHTWAEVVVTSFDEHRYELRAAGVQR